MHFYLLPSLGCVFPLSEKNLVKILKMSFCDSRDLEKIASVAMRGRTCGPPNSVALTLCSRGVLALRLQTEFRS